MYQIIENIFTTEVFATIISVLGGILIASLTYYFSKKKQRESEWQKEKLNFYIEFISSLTDNLDCGNVSGGSKKFSRASNNLYLFANTKVISALKDFQDEIRTTNLNRTRDGEAKTLGNLLNQMRSDIKIKDRSKNIFDLVHLWGWGNDDVKYNK